MSSLGGHWRLTKQAVEELRSGKESSPLMMALPAARLQDNAIARDLIDVLIPGPILRALKTRRPLIDLLIRSMDEGWTSAGEKACIDFLEGLKP